MASDDSAAPPPATSPAAPAAAPAADPLAGVPALTTAVAEAADDRVAALKLVADSVAQQRQAASRILLSHPVNVGAFGVVLAVVAQVLLAWKRELQLLYFLQRGVPEEGFGAWCECVLTGNCRRLDGAAYHVRRHLHGAACGRAVAYP